MKKNHQIDIHNTVNRLHREWAILVSQSYNLSDPYFKNEALGFACSIMKEARQAILIIIDSLQSLNYRFYDTSKVYIEPDPHISEFVASYQNHGVFLPLSMEAWLSVVGSVNLIGTMPQWGRPACIFDNAGGDKAEEVLITDPLVVELPCSYIEYLYDEWKTNKQDINEPFRVDFSPDDLHKANISGGLPYQLNTIHPLVDDLVLNEKHCTSFMNYIRTSILWKGFPGFDYIENAQQYWKPNSFHLF